MLRAELGVQLPRQMPQPLHNLSKPASEFEEMGREKKRGRYRKSTLLFLIRIFFFSKFLLYTSAKFCCGGGFNIKQIILTHKIVVPECLNLGLKDHGPGDIQYCMTSNQKMESIHRSIVSQKSYPSFLVKGEKDPHTGAWIPEYGY